MNNPGHYDEYPELTRQEKERATPTPLADAEAIAEREAFEGWFENEWNIFLDRETFSKIKAKVFALKAWKARAIINPSAPEDTDGEELGGATPIDKMNAILKSQYIEADEYTDCAVAYRVTFDQLRNLYDLGRAALATTEATDAIAPTGGAKAVPAVVIAWRDSYQAYIDAVANYNERVKVARSFGLGSVSVDAEYQVMNDAQREAMSLLKPMHAALSAPSPEAPAVDALTHASDCAVHNEPAYPNGPCDCGAEANSLNALAKQLRSEGLSEIAMWNKAVDQAAKVAEEWGSIVAPWIKEKILELKRPASEPKAPITGAAAYDMAYANGNRGLVYPEELAHIEKARIVTGYVATPLFLQHAIEPKATLDADELEEFMRTVADFEDTGETTTDHGLLMKWANAGLLDCSRFEVAAAGNKLIESLEKKMNQQYVLTVHDLESEGREDVATYFLTVIPEAKVISAVRHRKHANYLIECPAIAEDELFELFGDEKRFVIDRNHTYTLSADRANAPSSEEQS